MNKLHNCCIISTFGTIICISFGNLEIITAICIIIYLWFFRIIFIFINFDTNIFCWNVNRDWVIILFCYQTYVHIYIFVLFCFCVVWKNDCWHITAVNHNRKMIHIHGSFKYNSPIPLRIEYFISSSI